jgi:intergrase/recombinase
LSQEARGKSKPWWSFIDPGKLDPELRRRLLERLIGKHGVVKTARLLGVDRTLVYRMRKGRVSIGDHHLERILANLSQDEFEEELTLGEKLESLGILRENMVNYTLILQIITVAMRDPYSRDLVLRYITQHYREDLRQLLETELEMNRLQWTHGFEEFLRSRKKGRRIVRNDTIRYYRNLFRKYLEGRKLSRELVEEVAESGNQWLRVVFRHYAQYLYTRGEISHQTLFWILTRVPGRRSDKTPRNPVVDVGRLREALKYLRENHEYYYLLYRLMLESGLRFEHALRFLANPELEGQVSVYDRIYPRLYCDVGRGYCRVYLGFNRGLSGQSSPTSPLRPSNWLGGLHPGVFIVGVFSVMLLGMVLLGLAC